MSEHQQAISPSSHVELVEDYRCWLVAHGDWRRTPSATTCQQGACCCPSAAGEICESDAWDEDTFRALVNRDWAACSGRILGVRSRVAC
jgi:hypothetical protein